MYTSITPQRGIIGWGPKVSLHRIQFILFALFFYLNVERQIWMTVAISDDLYYI